MDPSSSSFSSMIKKKTKLSVKNQTCFKKPSLSSSAASKITNLSMREETMFKKAKELSILCDIEVCVIYYSRGGELKTWPEDKSKARDMAERFSTLNERERRKKSTNLSQFLNKKIISDKKTSLDNKDKALEMENSLEIHLRLFQDKLIRLLDSKKQNEPDDQSLIEASSSFLTTNLSSSSGLIEEPLNPKSDEFRYEQDLSHTSGFTTDLSPLIIEDSHQQWTVESLMSGVSSTEQDLLMPSLNQPQSSKFSLFLYNHDNGSFCQVPDSVSTFDQSMTTALLGAQGSGLSSNCDNFDLPMVFPPQMQTQTPLDQSMSTALLGAQGSGLSSNCNNFDLPMVFPPQMQTQTPLVNFDQFAAWNQTPAFGDPMMFSF